MKSTQVQGLVGLLAPMAIVGLAMQANAQSPQAASGDELSEVVVTGSRVVTNGNDSPTPVTVINVADSEQVRPATIAEQLNDMPQFSGSQGQNNGIGAGSANNGNPNGQANVLNLRNFGQTRTLILFDGHRASSTSPNGTVDVDMIPQMLLQRVDVVTGGASAVYGADAVTGVVNFITDTKFKGVKVNGQLGQSGERDDKGRAVGVAWGGDLFGGRGHLLASYEYRGDDGVDRRSSRAWFRQRPFVAQVANNAPAYNAAVGGTQYMLYLNATNNDRAFGGIILQPTNGAVNTGCATNTAFPYNQYFSSNGVLSPVDFGVRDIRVSCNVSVGGSGAYFDPSLKGALKMHQLFTRLDFDFSDSVHGYIKGSGTRNYNAAYQLEPPTYNPGSGNNEYNMRADNPYLTAAQQSQLAAAGITQFRFLKIQLDAPRQFTESLETQYSIDTGLNGQFGNGWKWEVAFIHAANKQDVRINKAENGLKLAAALDAVTVTSANVGTTGQTLGSIVCNVTLTNPGLYPGCVPYNPFGPTTMTQANRDYMFDPLKVVAYTDMNDLEAFVSGAPFSNWAGPVTMALSGQARKLGYHLDSNNIPSDAGNPLTCPGLRLAPVCNPGPALQGQTYFQSSSYAQPKKSVSVTEGALEFDLPLLKDKFLARDMSFNGAVRLTNYSTSGSVTTWKAGLDWKLTDELTLRGTRSRDIRAPTLFELYRPTAVGNLNTTDPWLGLSLSTSPAVTYTQGNDKLKPEKGDTVTLGLVYRPDWLQGFSAAVDYYYINVTDAILQLNGTDSATATACANSGGSSVACNLIVRREGCCTALTSTGLPNLVTKLYSQPFNVARQWTQGADLELSYSGRAVNMPFNVRLLTSYQPHNVVVNPIVGGTTENAGFYGSSATWRGTLVTSISPTENFRISVQERYRNRMSWTPRNSGGILPQVMMNAPSISSVFFTNLNLSYTLNKLGGKTDIYFNIANLFNREAPIASGLNIGFPGNAAPVAGDDIVGRYYTLGFRYRR